MQEIQQYINNEISPLGLNDSIISAQDLLIDFKFTHLPIVNDGIFLGNFLAEDIENANLNTKVVNFNNTFDVFFTLSTTNWFDVLQIFSKYETNIVPVLNNENKYIGYYELNDIIKFMAESPFFSEEGNTLIVSKGINSYSISEITQIIESNNSKILGLFISDVKDNNVEVSIKISASNMNDILRTFRRYDYEIISEHIDDTYITNLKNRSDYLDKYLNI